MIVLGYPKLTRREDPRGRRARSAYELTERGLEALLAWLRSPREGTTHFRDEGVLRLFAAQWLSRLQAELEVA